MFFFKILVTSFAVMDPNNNTPSLLKLIKDYDPIFLVSFFSFQFFTHNKLLHLTCFLFRWIGNTV
ncbi:hypothetical protein Hdeb2414_s0005g00156921 [Helianthus debilis subsp. tardiflorus]